MPLTSLYFEAARARGHDPIARLELIRSRVRLWLTLHRRARLAGSARELDLDRLEHAVHVLTTTQGYRSVCCCLRCLQARDAT